jgi:hypothetical protein
MHADYGNSVASKRGSASPDKWRGHAGVNTTIGSRESTTPEAAFYSLAGYNGFNIRTKY